MKRDGPTWPRSGPSQRALAEGRAVLVFPEGTRGDEGQLREAKPGAALLAVRVGAPVVPAYVAGAGGPGPADDGSRGLPR